MKNGLKCVLFLAGAFVAFILVSNSASACPYLECANFTESDKINDCHYITERGLPEEQEVLCALWEQSYDFDSYKPEEYELKIDFSTEDKKINNSRFRTAFKISLFGLFNYLVFSLTKSSRLIKWFS